MACKGLLSPFSHYLFQLESLTLLTVHASIFYYDYQLTMKIKKIVSFAFKVLEFLITK